MGEQTMRPPAWPRVDGARPVRYVVIRDDRVVQRILASTADDALRQQEEQGELAVMVGG